MGQRVAGDGIIGQMPRIGLVFAHAQIGLRAQQLQQGLRQALIGGIKNAHMPGPGRAPAQLRGKAVDGHDHRIGAARGQLRQCGVIGAVAAVEPLLQRLGAGMAIGGNDRAVVKLHQQRWVIFAAVRIDHKAREIRQDRAAPQMLRQGACHPSGANVIGDMAVHIRRRDAQIAAAHKGWHSVCRVIAGDQPTCVGGFIHNFEGCICHRAVFSFVQALGQNAANWNCRRLRAR